MACHRFTSAIRAHALGSSLDADVSAHLAVCSQCQATLEIEKRLLATIDVALDEVTSTAPGLHFIARVRTHVEAAPRRWPPAALRIPTAATALALMIAIAFVNRPRDGSTMRDAVALPTADVPLAAPLERAVDRPVTATAEPARQGRTSRRPARGRIARAPEVLVPRGERAAVDRLFASLRAGRPEVVSMLMRLHNDEAVIEERGVTIPPLRIEPVIVPAMPSSAFIFDK